MPAVATTTLTTAEELLAMPDDGWRYELIEGVLHRRPPAGGEHGEIETELVFHLRLYVAARGLGKVYLGDTGFVFERDPDLVRFPDVAFVRTDRLPTPNRRRGHMPVIPDLAIEIVSLTGAPQEVAAKVAFYRARGVPLVWTVHPADRTVAVHRAAEPARVLGLDDVLDSEDVVPGFRLPVADIFR